jgi:hypothetical protein
MIDRNIGRTERIVRFILGLVLIAWAAVGADALPLRAVAVIAAGALLWNSIFARCYLWKWLGITSCDPAQEDCPPRGGAAGA